MAFYGCVQSEFTEDEIQAELMRLGIRNIDENSLRQFRDELQNLVKEMSTSSIGKGDVSSSSSHNAPWTCSNMSTSGSPLSSSLSVASPLTTPPLIDGPRYRKPISKHIAGGELPYRDVDHFIRPLPPSSATTVSYRPPPALQPQRQPTTSAAGSIIYSGNSYVTGPPDLDQILTSDCLRLGSRQNNIHPAVMKEQNSGTGVGSSSSRITTTQQNCGFPYSQHIPTKLSRCVNTDSEEDKENQGVPVSHPYVGLHPTSSFSSNLLKATQTDLPSDYFNEGLLNELLSGNCDQSDEAVPPPPPPPAKVFTKRKISRKGPDGKSYVDESYSESDSGSMIDPVEYLERLREMNKSVYDVAREKPYYHQRPMSADNRPKSVILAPTTPPKLKKKKKTDPVNRHRQFRDYWSMFKVPGENNHNELRWSIKEKMAQQYEIETRPRKVYVPNDYVVPTEKKRKSLRWQIRTDMAYGLMPAVSYYKDP